MTDKVKKTKKFKSPSAFSILIAIIIAMAGLTWVVPSGAYNMVPNKEKPGEMVREPGSYKQIEKVSTEKNEETGKEVTTDLRQGFWDVAISPIKGMADKLGVIIFVLILGGFLGVVMKTGALDAAIGGLLKKMKGHEKWLIPILMTLFAIGGTTYGMQEEAVAFYALVVPIMLAAGYNAMTAVMVIVLGGGVGVLASTVNPFSTGAAAEAAGMKLGNILGIQSLLLAILLVVAITFTMRYAAKVKAGQYKEDTAEKSAVKAMDLAKVPEFTARRKFVLAIFALTFVIMVISLIPWTEDGFKIFLFEDIHNWLIGLPVIGALLGARHGLPFGGWYFDEISMLFLVSTALIIAAYYKEFKKSEISPVDTFIDGARDLLGVALIIAVAAAVGVVMQAGGIQDTIIHWGEEMLKSVSGGVVGVLAYIFYLPMSFIIPSSSGLAAATMPVIAPIADIVGSSKEAMVVAFATASGLLNMIAPTIASLLAGLALAGVPYKKWLKRTAPVMAAFAVISIIFVYVIGSM